MAEVFYMGGAAMWLIVLFGLSALVAAILHAAFARRWSFIVAVVHLPLPLLAGIGGWLYGLYAVARALEYAAGSGFMMRSELEAQGNAEARIPLYGGLAVFVLCAVPFAIGCARRARRP